MHSCDYKENRKTKVNARWILVKRFAQTRKMFGKGAQLSILSFLCHLLRIWPSFPFSDWHLKGLHTSIYSTELSKNSKIEKYGIMYLAAPISCTHWLDENKYVSKVPFCAIMTGSYKKLSNVPLTCISKSSAFHILYSINTQEWLETCVTAYVIYRA